MDDLRQRTGPLSGKESLPKGVIQPFGKPSLTPFSIVIHEMKPVFKDKRGKRILWLGVFNISCATVLMMWCKSTNSMGLTACTYLTLFDLLSLGTCLLSLWVEQQKPNQSFTFGYERFEVLAVFSSSILAQLSSFFILKQSVERLIQQPEIHTGRLFPGIMLAFICHLIVTYGMQNRAFNHVVAASSSSWLQEHVAEMSQSVCHIVPGLSTILLPRVNPFILLGWAEGIILIITMLLIEMYNYHAADPVAAIIIGIIVCVTMFPVSSFSGRILLQTTPSHIVGQLDKCLREASTLDGVLEFRNEHFWTLAFDNLAGSVHVRIRRDANEQLVLAHLVDRLSNLVSDLTIQVFKDEWAWSTTTLQLLNESALKYPQGTVSPALSVLSQPVVDGKGPPVNYTSVLNSLRLPNSGTSVPISQGLPSKLPDGPSSLQYSSSNLSQSTQNTFSTTRTSNVLLNSRVPVPPSNGRSSPSINTAMPRNSTDNLPELSR